MVLTKGQGKLVFMGNVSVEEGMVSHNALLHRFLVNCGVLINVCCLQVCMISPPRTSVLPLSGKSIALVSPDLTVPVCLFSPDANCLFPRTYCETDVDPSHRKYSQLQAAIRYLQGKEPDLECTIHLSCLWC